MLTVVIPTLNAGETLAPVLSALVPGVVEGLVRDVVIADGGSDDATLAIADASGATVVQSAAGRGTQLAAGARAAKGDWLLFLHGDTILQDGWVGDAGAFIADASVGTKARQSGAPAVAAFRFALDDRRARARILERLVALRCKLLRLPYGDQGLLIKRRLYEEVGGFRDLPLMEDVDLVRRIGRRQIMLLDTRAVTSAARFRRDGYLRRSLRNLSCLGLYYLRISPRTIARFYG